MDADGWFVNSWSHYSWKRLGNQQWHIELHTHCHMVPPREASTFQALLAMWVWTIRQRPGSHEVCWQQWIPNFGMVSCMGSHSPLQGLVLPSSAKAGLGQGIHESIPWAQNWYRLLARSFSFADNRVRFWKEISLPKSIPCCFSPRLNPWTACWKDVDVSPPAPCWEAWREGKRLQRPSWSQLRR